MKNVMKLLLVWAILQGPVAVSAEPAGYVVVVHPDVAESSLDEDELRMIYLGTRRKWENGGRITIAIRPNSPSGELFIRNVLGKTSRQFLLFWKSLVFTGKSAMPRTFADDEELLDYVRSNEGAIGLVSADMTLTGVRVLQVSP